MRTIASVGVACLLAVSAHATTVDVSVGGTQGPWDQTVNPAMTYGSDDNTAPTSVSTGFDFSVGSMFTVTYISGTTTVAPSIPGDWDANGDTNYVENDGIGASGHVFPS